jgi:hypothetical protein
MDALRRANRIRSFRASHEARVEGPAARTAGSLLLDPPDGAVDDEGVSSS